MIDGLLLGPMTHFIFSRIRLTIISPWDLSRGGEFCLGIWTSRWDSCMIKIAILNSR